MVGGVRKYSSNVIKCEHRVECGCFEEKTGDFVSNYTLPDTKVCFIVEPPDI